MGENTLQFTVHLITPRSENSERVSVGKTIERFNTVVGETLGATVKLARGDGPGEHCTDEDTQSGEETEETADGNAEPELSFIVIRSVDGESTPDYVSSLSATILELKENNHPFVAYSVDRPLGDEDDELFLLDCIGRLESQLPSDSPVWSYQGLEELTDFVFLHLTRFVSEKICWNRAHRMSIALRRQTAPIPDIRVKAALAVACPTKKQRIPCLSVTVENHSPQNIFVARVFIRTAEGNKLVIKHDFLTGEPYEKKRVLPGDNTKYTLSVKGIKDMPIAPETMTHLVAEDAIGREYYSAPLDFVKILTTAVS